MSDLGITPEELAQIANTVVTDDQSVPGSLDLNTLSSPLVPNATPIPETAPQPAAPQPAAPPPPKQNQIEHTAHPANFAPLSPGSNGSPPNNLDLLLGVSLRVTVELGRTEMSIEEVLKMGPGSVIELEKLAGEPVDVLVNDHLIARGEVVVIDDRFGVRITDVIPPAQRLTNVAV